MFRTVLLLSSLSLAWGVSFLFIELALESFSPLVVVQLRVAIGALLLLGFLAARGEGLPRSRDFWTIAIAMGFFNNLVPFLAIVTAQTALNSGITSVLNATMPFFTVMIALGLREVERIIPTVLGVGVGFLGVVLLADWSDVTTRPPLWALGLMMLSAISYSIAVYVGRRLSGKGTGSQAATAMLLSSSIMVLPFAASGLIGQMASASLTSWLAILGIGSFSTALAYLFYFALIKQAGATITSLVTFILPVIALALGALFLGERYSLGVFVGCGLIFAGLALVFWSRNAAAKE